MLGESDGRILVAPSSLEGMPISHRYTTRSVDRSAESLRPIIPPWSGNHLRLRTNDPEASNEESNHFFTAFYNLTFQGQS